LGRSNWEYDLGRHWLAVSNWEFVFRAQEQVALAPDCKGNLEIVTSSNCLKFFFLSSHHTSETAYLPTARPSSSERSTCSPAGNLLSLMLTRDNREAKFARCLFMLSVCLTFVINVQSTAKRVSHFQLPSSDNRWLVPLIDFVHQQFANYPQRCLFLLHRPSRVSNP